MKENYVSNDALRITCVLSACGGLWIGTADGTLYIYDVCERKPTAGSWLSRSKKSNVFVSSPDLTAVLRTETNYRRSASPDPRCRTETTSRPRTKPKPPVVIGSTEGQRRAVGTDCGLTTHKLSEYSAARDATICRKARRTSSAAMSYENVLQLTESRSGLIVGGNADCKKPRYTSESGRNNTNGNSCCGANIASYTDNDICLPILMKLQSKIKVSERPVSQLVDARYAMCLCHVSKVSETQRNCFTKAASVSAVYIVVLLHGWRAPADWHYNVKPLCCFQILHLSTKVIVTMINDLYQKRLKLDQK